MRAIYISQDLEGTSLIELAVKDHHHLVNVARIKPGEKVLLLNGKGKILDCEIETLSKKAFTLKVLKETQRSTHNRLKLALGVPKRDALEQSIRNAVEIGILEIHLVKCDYSNFYPKNLERIEKIVISAIEQSNNPFFPKLVEHSSLKDFLNASEDEVLFFNSLPSENGKELPKKCSLLIGPEGGFSEKELGMLKESEKVTNIFLPTNILRSETAVSVASGVYIQALGIDKPFQL